ncbi:transcriptional regulator [[Actinobacillus] muris]|uniref:Transcriptional regulator n=1 Tax=Muribacter muris TaxID=67855 RepID=A0A0J5S6A7_9PAST|nr:MerR family DNA-binding protein [Muribacter muris]KMK52397.1 transcriptional regulator [[Actinobacillus] muris] [Muribacter muris]
MNISQASKLSGLSAKQIRDYEKAGLLPEMARSASGYRLYSDKMLARLHFIGNARKVGFSLAQIGELLKLNDDSQRSSREVKQLTEQHILELKAKIADLEAMVSLLQSWHCACQGNEKPECSILQGLEKHNF